MVITVLESLTRVQLMHVIDGGSLTKASYESSLSGYLYMLIAHYA